MRNTSWILLAGLLLCGAAGADEPVSTDMSDEVVAPRIYRVVDEQGRVTFTDRAPARGQAQEVIPSRSNVVHMQDVVQTLQAREAGPGDSPDSPAADEAPQVRISAPADGETFRNPESPIAISVQVEGGDDLRLRLTANGQELRGAQLPMERGAYTLRAELLSADGKVSAQSEPVTVYVHRTTIHQRPKPPAPPKP